MFSGRLRQEKVPIGLETQQVLPAPGQTRVPHEVEESTSGWRIDGVEDGIIKGMYLYRQGSRKKKRVQLLGSGTILREVIAAAELLENEWDVSADVWSVTSFNELRRDGIDAERWNMLHPGKKKRIPYISQQLAKTKGPVVAATDYMRTYADQVRNYILHVVRATRQPGEFGMEDLAPLIDFGASPRATMQSNWEVRDLLKTAATQAASHVAQMKALQALAEAQQFEGFHRLSAFVLHDIKNLIAQQTLVVNSAARHKHKPEFIEDAVEIMEHSVAKMRRLMDLLHSGLPEGKTLQVNLVVLIKEAVRNCSGNQPVPHYQDELQQLTVLADRDRLTSVIENIIRNAQDATPNDGYVNIHLSQQGDKATVTVEDNGCGMSTAFIRERLFRPFDTTKGNAGMGIGMYEAREFIRQQGGEIDVQSEPGQGTTISLRIPAGRAFGEAASA